MRLFLKKSRTSLNPPVQSRSENALVSGVCDLLGCFSPALFAPPCLRKFDLILSDTHWEYFYDQDGQPLIRVYRRLGQLRSSSRALRGTQTYYYYQQSHQQNQVIAYHRYAPATATDPEEWAMVLLNFAAARARFRCRLQKQENGKRCWTQTSKPISLQSP